VENKGRGVQKGKERKGEVIFMSINCFQVLLILLLSI
jgi:hypothetical protein